LHVPGWTLAILAAIGAASYIRLLWSTASHGLKDVGAIRWSFVALTIACAALPLGVEAFRAERQPLDYLSDISHRPHASIFIVGSWECDRCKVIVSELETRRDEGYTYYMVVPDGQMNAPAPSPLPPWLRVRSVPDR